MDLSVIVPVFNKSGLTRICLSALKRTLPAAIESEVIVIDNNSTDDTPAMLREFPWVRVIRNASNLGFAAANNQGAGAATGTMLLLLNNDTEPQEGSIGALMRAGAEPDVGVVGARLLFANRTLQHAGVVVSQERFGPYRYIPYHYLWSDPANAPAANYSVDYQIVTGACILTPRSLYRDLGGLDESFWNGYEDVDYCFKVLCAGKRVLYEPQAEIYHYESQSGPMRFSRVAYNSTLLARKWPEFPKIDHVEHYLRAGNIRRTSRFSNKFSTVSQLAPKTTVIVHGAEIGDSRSFVKGLMSGYAPVVRVVWTLDSPPPSIPGVTVVHAPGPALRAAQAEMQVRGDRYLAFVNSGVVLEDRWLDRLLEQLEWASDVVAATAPAEDCHDKERRLLTADARCTVLTLRNIPQHEALGEFQSLDGAVSDLLLRMMPYEYGVRAAAESVGVLPALAVDAMFMEKYSQPVGALLRDDPAFIEDTLRNRARRQPHDLQASIVMLSWNAPQFTKIALESIRAHTTMPHEIIIVDNGSGPETTQWLRTLSDVKVIYNPTNRGFAGGCNQGMAAAGGDYIVLLNNDVVVTDGWLENLVAAVERDPGTGVSAPRSNEITGHQKLLDLQYDSMEAMHRVANRRNQEQVRGGYFTDRAIGFCLCIDRKVIEQVGGIDERYGTGNFEDDDFCLRVRAAGYRIYVCNDVFIHHFGSVSFQTNSVDYAATMQRNWSIFANKWGYPAVYPQTGYEPARAIHYGFDRSKHFVPLAALPAPSDSSQAGAPEVALLLAVVIRDESDWSVGGKVVRRYLSAFDANDSVLFAITCIGELDAQTVGSRVEKMMKKLDVDPARSPDVDVCDETDLRVWLEPFNARERFEIVGASGEPRTAFAALEGSSPSDLRRLYTQLISAASV